MNKKKLLQIKRNILKRIKTTTISKESIKELETLGFSIKYDRDYNLYLYDNIHDERMYTNTVVVKATTLKLSENKYYSLEFSLKNKNIKGIRLYEKGKRNKLVYKR